MHEIDLIPNSYRERHRKSQWISIFAVLCVVILVLEAGSYGAISLLTDRERSALQTLQRNKTLTTMQQEKLQGIESEIVNQHNQLRILNGFRDGVPVGRIFQLVDQALENRGIWFLRWQFHRAGLGSEDNRNTGDKSYSELVAEHQQRQSFDSSSTNAHINISGQALDYSYLSSFVDNLSSATEIAEIRIIDTKLQQKLTGSVVNFRLAITLTATEYSD